jgi:hypothetical protein
MCPITVDNSVITYCKKRRVYFLAVNIISALMLLLKQTWKYTFKYPHLLSICLQSPGEHYDMSCKNHEYKFRGDIRAGAPWPLQISSCSYREEVRGVWYTVRITNLYFHPNQYLWLGYFFGVLKFYLFILDFVLRGYSPQAFYCVFLYLPLKTPITDSYAET